MNKIKYYNFICYGFEPMLFTYVFTRICNIQSTWLTTKVLNIIILEKKLSRAFHLDILTVSIVYTRNVFFMF